MKTLLGIIVLAVLAGGGWYAWHMFHANDHGLAFKTVPVEKGDLLAAIGATGTIEPEEVVDIGAQVVGQIKKFGPDPRDKTKTVDYGTPVEAGTVLAELDDAVYRSQLEQAEASKKRAEADLLQMKARLRQTQRDWVRAQQLRPSGSIADLDYDTAQAAFETAQANLAVGEATITQAEATRRQAEINLGYTIIRSSVKGVIVDRRVNVGQTIVSSLNAPSLFLIAKDLSRLQVWAAVNEADIGHIFAGQKVRFTVDARPGKTFDGTVAQIRLNATMTQNVVTYTVVVEADNKDGQLLPYLTANLQFEVEKRAGVLKVPNAALRWQPPPGLAGNGAGKKEGGGPGRERSPGGGGPGAAPPKSEAAPGTGTVWVQEGDTVRPIHVKVGLSDGAVTEVSGEGLREGMPVIVATSAAGGRDNGGNVNPFTPNMFGGRRAAQ